MDDRLLMEDLLIGAKSACDLYLHGTLESAGTANVHCAFDNALTKSLEMQEKIYQKMSEKGWYQTQQAEQQKVQQVKQKFSV